MIKIIVLPNNRLCYKGKLIRINNFKENLCDILINNNILIDHFCEKFGKCITCIVTVKEGYNLLNKIDFEELESLSKITTSKKNLRLTCQTYLSKNLNIIIKINESIL